MTQNAQAPRVMVCTCAKYRTLPEEGLLSAIETLAERNAAFDVVGDLCGLAATRADALARYAHGSPLHVVACAERNVRCLLDFANAPDPAKTEVAGLREQSGRLPDAGQTMAPRPAGKTLPVIALLPSDSPAAIPIPRRAALIAGVCDLGLPVRQLSCLCELADLAAGGTCIVLASLGDLPPAAGDERTRFLDVDTCQDDAAVLAAAEQTARQLGWNGPEPWVPWYPVIDRARCNDCKQCLGFCLFGVFALNDGRVEVANPDHCKTNCPACARVCPQAAILFPKYESAPVNGDHTAETPAAQPVQVDLRKLVGGNLYEALRRRDQGETTTGAAPAAAATSMAELTEKLGIPPEVLAGLSPQERAKLARKVDGGEGATQ
ncbi:MAG: hypothetical protein ACLFV7_06560 [Phycisphaerae bacterium]